MKKCLNFMIIYLSIVSCGSHIDVESFDKNRPGEIEQPSAPDL